MHRLVQDSFYSPPLVTVSSTVTVVNLQYTCASLIILSCFSVLIIFIIACVILII